MIGAGPNMPSIAFAALASATALLALSGCVEQAVMVTGTQEYPLSTLSLRSYVSTLGGFGLVTVDGPDMPSRSEADRQIASMLRVPGRTDISTTPIRDRKDTYRIVLIFDPSGRNTPGDAEICSGNITSRAPIRWGETMHIHGAVCATDRIVSRATTTSAKLAPTDKGFRRVTEAMMQALFPAVPEGDRADAGGGAFP